MSANITVTQATNWNDDVKVDPVAIIVSASAVGSGTTLLMTVYTAGTVATAGASFWVVPSGRTFRINQMQIAAVSSAILGAARMMVLLGTAAASLSVTTTVGVAAVLPYGIQGSTTPFDVQGLKADVAAGTSVAIGVQGGSAHSIIGAVVQGYLF